MKKHEREPVVITGVGTHGAGGRSVAELWDNTMNHHICVEERATATGRKYVVYSSPEPLLEWRWPKMVKHADRSAKLALAAARQAWSSACLSTSDVDPERVGVLIGSSRGPAATAFVSANRRARATDAVYTALSSTAGMVAAELGAGRCAQMVSATCISGAVALQTALLLLRSGELDVAVVGGVDAPLVDHLLEQFAAAGVLATGADKDALRPFDGRRSGTVVGEGAAVVIVETEAHARGRGAHIHGSIHAVATGCEPHLRTSMSMNAGGLQQTARRALACANLAPTEIDLLVLHGTGTRLNDLMESRCVGELFGAPAQQPYSLATKAITGHNLGASSVFQLLAGLESMRHGFVPATANCDALDPECPLRIAHGVPANVRHGLCLTSGFWGNSACIVFGQAR